MLKYSKKNNINKSLKKYYNIYKNKKKTKRILGGANIKHVEQHVEDPHTQPPKTSNLSKIYASIVQLGVFIPPTAIKAIFLTIKASLDIVNTLMENISEFSQIRNKTLEGIHQYSIDNPDQLEKIRKKYKRFINDCVKDYDSSIPKIIENVIKLISTQHYALNKMLINIGCKKSIRNTFTPNEFRGNCINSSKNDYKQALKNSILSTYRQLIILQKKNKSELNKHIISNEIMSVKMKKVASGLDNEYDMYSRCIEYRDFIKNIQIDIEKYNPFRLSSDTNIMGSDTNNLYSKIVTDIEEFNDIDRKQIQHKLDEIRAIREQVLEENKLIDAKRLKERIQKEQNALLEKERIQKKEQNALLEKERIQKENQSGISSINKQNVNRLTNINRVVEQSGNKLTNSNSVDIQSSNTSTNSNSMTSKSESNLEKERTLSNMINKEKRGFTYSNHVDIQSSNTTTNSKLNVSKRNRTLSKISEQSDIIPLNQ